MDDIYIKTSVLSDHLQYEYFRARDIISINDLIEALEDAYYEINELKDEFEEYKEDVEKNYQPIINNDWEED